MTTNTPVDIPIVHAITGLYKSLYVLGKKVPKRDRFGVHALVEKVCLESLSLAIEAALLPKSQKKDILLKLRRKIEVLKHMIRMSFDLKIIEDRMYLDIQKKLQEISKMAGGWLKYSS